MSNISGLMTPPCAHCGSGAVIEGRCAVCGLRQTPTGTVVKAKAPKKCRAHRWGPGKDAGPYAGRQEQRCTRCPATRTVETFKWEASTPLDVGIRAACDWYAEHGVGDTYTHLVMPR